jgi:hypothetical protein
MKKTFLFLVLFFSTFVSYGQVTIDYLDCTSENLRPYTPAPCAINGSGVRVDLHMIQVGAYRQYITPEAGIMIVPSVIEGNGTTEMMFRYYYASFFPSKEAAEQFLQNTNFKKRYCDAMVVPIPFQGVIGFN